MGSKPNPIQEALLNLLSQGITNGQICKATGLFANQVSAYMSGRTMPSMVIFGRMAQTIFTPEQVAEILTGMSALYLERGGNRRTGHTAGRKLYTRKQVQEAASQAYNKGVEHKPVLDKFDEWLEDEKSPPHAHSQGHKIVFIDEQWVYADSKAPIADEVRPCARCGKDATPEGYDACTGHVPGAMSVCCGHGVTKPILIEGEEMKINS